MVPLPAAWRATSENAMHGKSMNNGKKEGRGLATPARFLSPILPFTRARGVTVAVALPDLALSVVQEELRLILTGSLSARLLSFLLRRVYGRRSLVAFSH